MEISRIFVIWTHPLFHESVRLLLDHPEVEWVGSSSDFQSALAEVTKLQPDTIIFEEVGEPVSAKIFDSLEGPPWKIRILGLNLENNELFVYQREQKTVAQSEDLLTFIKEKHW